MVDRSMGDALRSIGSRLTSLERRLVRTPSTSPALPPRLSATGEVVTDWNLAREVGFYSGNAALNQPANPADYYSTSTHNWWVGQVLRMPYITGDRLLQYVSRPNFANGWEFVRRSFNGGATWEPWVNIGYTEDWTDLKGYLATGITYVADGASDLAGIRARRIGPFTELSLGNFRVDTMSVPVTGNIANRDVLLNFPAKFRPSVGVGIAAGWAGRGWSGYVRPNGSVIMGAVVPNSGNAATVTLNNETFSGTAFYPTSAP